MKVFLSHIHEEDSLALVIKEWIESSFPSLIQVFVSSDIKDVPAGMKWFDEINRALGESQVLIVLCSPNSIQRPWINFETGCAWIKDIPIIALCHSGQSTSTLPRPLSDFQDLSIDDDPNFIDKFLSSLAKHLGIEKVPRIDKSSMLSEISDAINSLSNNVQSLVSNNAQKTVPALLIELRDGKSTRTQANAARELGKIVGLEISSALSDATKVRSPGVKTAANEAIEEIQSKFSVLVDQSVTSKKATEEYSSSNLEDIEDQILMFIAENNGVSIPKLVQQFGMHKAKMEYHLDNLTERKLINFSHSMTSSPTLYFLDKVGRRHLVDKNLL